MTCCIDEIKPLGTFGAIANVASKFHSKDYLVLNGDTIFEANFKNLYKKYCENEKNQQLYLKKAKKMTDMVGISKKIKDGFLQKKNQQFISLGAFFYFIMSLKKDGLIRLIFLLIRL